MNDPVPSDVTQFPIEAPTSTPHGRRVLAIVAGLLSSLAGVLLVLVGDRTVAKVFLDDLQIGTQRLEQDGVLVFLALVVIVAGVAAAIWGSAPGARAAIACAVSLVALFIAFLLVGLRVDDDFGTSARHRLGPGGWLIALAFIALLVAIVALVLSGRQFVGATTATAALVLGIVGLIVVPLAPMAIMFGRGRPTEGGRTGGHTAGLVLGIVSLVLWFGSLGLAAMFAHP
jgi:hypothetical protein